MRRSASAILIASALLLAHAPPAHAQAIVINPIDVINGGGDDKPKDSKDSNYDCPTLVPITCAVDDVVDGVTGAAGDVAVQGAQAVGGAVMGGLASWVGEGAAWLVRKIGEQIDRSSRPALGSTWFSGRYAQTRDIGIALSALFLLLAVLHALLRQDVGRLLRSALVALPLSMGLTFGAVLLVQSGLQLTDWMTASVLGTLDDDAGRAFADLARLFLPVAASGNPLPGFVVFLAAFITALLSLLVWLELVLREAAIYVAVAFLPLTFSAMVWERTAHWSRRLAEWLAALILAKFTIACAFAVAVAALGNARGGSGGLSAIMAGSAILLVAAVTPWALLRLIPIGTDAVMQRGHIGAAVRSTPGVGTGTVLARDVMMVRFRGAVAGASAASKTGRAATAAAPIAQRPSRGEDPPVPPSGSFSRRHNRDRSSVRRDAE
jgi:hypothetical protein